MGPVYAGELQCRGLGMKIESFDEKSKPVYGKQGELVCTAPSPSMPIYFWHDPDHRKYHDAYFNVYPGVWRHGDYIEVNDHGGVIIYGRSDTTLNPGGVRIGTAIWFPTPTILSPVTGGISFSLSFYTESSIRLYYLLCNR